MRISALVLALNLFTISSSAQTPAPFNFAIAWQSTTRPVVAGSHLLVTATQSRRGVLELNARDGSLGTDLIPLWPLLNASHGDLVVGTSTDGRSLVAYDLGARAVRFQARCSQSPSHSCHLRAAAADATRIYILGTPMSATSDQSAVFAIDATSGRELWRVSLGEATSDPSASLILESGRVFAMVGHEKIRALDSTNGNLLWARDLPPRDARGVYGHDLLATNELVVFVEVNASIHIAHAATGRDIHTIARTEGVGDIALGAGMLYVMSWYGAHGNNIVAIDTQSGRQLFRHARPETWLIGPMVYVSGALVARSATNSTDAGNGMGNALVAVDAASGRLLATRDFVNQTLAVLPTTPPLLITSGRSGTVGLIRGAVEAGRRVHIQGVLCPEHNIQHDQFIAHVGAISAPIAPDGSFQIDAVVTGGTNIAVSGRWRSGMEIYTVDDTSLQLVPGQNTYSIRIPCVRHMID